jgi:hypothetical protein
MTFSRMLRAIVGSNRFLESVSYTATVSPNGYWLIIKILFVFQTNITVSMNPEVAWNCRLALAR